MDLKLRIRVLGFKLRIRVFGFFGKGFELKDLELRILGFKV